MRRGRRGEDPWGLLCSSRPGRCLLWLWSRQISGRRVACPPARRPRRELRSARRLEARPGPAGPAAAFLLVVLVAPLVFRAPEGPAAREARRPHFVRRRASKPARALRSLRRPPHRRCLRFWCECACYGPAAAFRVGGCGECGRIRIGCRYPDVCYLSGCVAAWARWPPCGVATGPASGLRCCSFACNSL